jgi:hypothetical protein
MANPLHKNKVIQFIKRYPNTEEFVLTTGNTPLSQGSPNSFTPGCNVGLSGQPGNPTNFNDLIDMWVAGGLVRNNINPSGLMRLWAAAYRTYYDWCRTVKRPYFNPVSSTVTTQQRLLNLDEYEVKFTSNLNTGSVNGTSTTGALSQGKFLTGGSTPLNGFSRREAGNTIPEVRTTAYIPSVLYSTSQITENTTITTLVSLPAGAIGLMYGGPIKCELLFNNAVDVQAIEIPNTSYNASPSTPEGSTPFNWFFPSNFELRASYDGINYSNSFKYSSIISSLNQTVSVDTSGGPFDWRQIIEAQISYTSTSLLTALNNISIYSSSVNSKANLETWLVNDANPASPTSLNQTTYGFPNDTPFTTRIKSITSSISGYDLNQFTVGRLLKGHEVEVVTVMQGSTPKTCIVKTWFRQNSIPRKLNGSATQLIPSEYETNALFPLNYGYFEVIDISSTGGRICTGTCESPLSFKSLRALEIISGVNDGLTLRPYMISFPRVVGSIKSFTTTINNTVTGNNAYIPNYLDIYWTNNSPESFTIGTTQFSDEIVRNAFLTVNYTGNNVDKWKRLPYTLPTTGIFLDSQIKSSSLTVKDVPIEFDYNEDYLNNKIIPLPTNQELIDFETEALGLGRDPVVHYFRTKISAFLLELINYCKSTCLKFWQYGLSTRSVSNYRTYTAEVLQFDNLTLPLQSVIGSAIKVYEIPTTGSFDIETNNPASRLWFLSGGGASRVDIDIAVLQQLLDIAGITV